jgi:hypothetical protein
VATTLLETMSHVMKVVGKYIWEEVKGGGQGRRSSGTVKKCTTTANDGGRHDGNGDARLLMVSK